MNDKKLGFELKATSLFTSASIALIVTSLFSMVSDYISGKFQIVIVGVSAVFFVFAYIVSVMGFSQINKMCRLDKNNENFFLGRNLTIVAVLSLVLSVIGELAALVCYVLLAQYRSEDALSDADRTAMGNLAVITAIVLIFVQLVAISTPYIFYLWKIHKLTSKSDSINNFALLTMIILLVQLAIGILSAMYSVRGTASSFLTLFSSGLLVIKYIVLMLFFITRRKGLINPPAPTDDNVRDNGSFEIK